MVKYLKPANDESGIIKPFSYAQHGGERFPVRTTDDFINTRIHNDGFIESLKIISEAFQDVLVTHDQTNDPTETMLYILRDKNESASDKPLLIHIQPDGIFFTDRSFNGTKHIPTHYDNSSGLSALEHVKEYLYRNFPKLETPITDTFLFLEKSDAYKATRTNTYLKWKQENALGNLRLPKPAHD